MPTLKITSVRATTLSPFHFHSLAVQDGTATLATFMPDRTMSFALGGALGALLPSPALPKKDYGTHLRNLPALASVFEALNPRLLKPTGKRLNLDGEGGYTQRIINATSSGNLKTWFFIQEVPKGVVYEGAFFGSDPFELFSSLSGSAESDEIIIRTGRHLSGLMKLERTDLSEARINLHTPRLLGLDPPTDIDMELYALHDLQLSEKLSLDRIAEIYEKWVN